MMLSFKNMKNVIEEWNEAAASRTGVVHVKEGGAIFIYTTTSTVSSLVANLATGLANKYIR